MMVLDEVSEPTFEPLYMAVPWPLTIQETKVLGDFLGIVAGEVWGS